MRGEMCVSHLQRTKPTSAGELAHYADVGISQREVTEHFPALMQQKEAHLETLTDFFDEHLQSKFPQADYAFDAYITSSGKVAVAKLRAVLQRSDRMHDWTLIVIY